MTMMQVVYDAIFGSDGFYHSPVDEACRSLMNVPFTIPSSPELEKAFVSEAASAGMVRADHIEAGTHTIGPVNELKLLPGSCLKGQHMGAGPVEGPSVSRWHACIGLQCNANGGR